MTFVYCTLLGLFTIILGLALLIGGILGIGYTVGQIADRSSDTVKLVGRGIGKVLLACLVLIVSGILIVGAHDMGCDLRGHPEHKLLKDDSQPKMNMPKENK